MQNGQSRKNATTMSNLNPNHSMAGLLGVVEPAPRSCEMSRIELAGMPAGRLVCGRGGCEEERGDADGETDGWAGALGIRGHQAAVEARVGGWGEATDDLWVAPADQPSLTTQVAGELPFGVNIEWKGEQRLLQTGKPDLLLSEKEQWQQAGL